MKKIAFVAFINAGPQISYAWPKLRPGIAIAILTLCFQVVCTNSFAQFTKLHDFDVVPDGSFPQGSLLSDGTFLYGMVTNGGANSNGVIFKIKPDGTGYLKLLDFSSATTGSFPQGSLISDGTFLYGVTAYGGSNNKGTIFKILPDGTGYAKLLDFANAPDGALPRGSLILEGNFLYGMTSAGGINDYGTIFRIKPDGTGYAKLLDFNGASNGRGPEESLMSDGTFLYGMTGQGGANDFGTIFKIKPDETGYAKLLDFSGTINGAYPYGSIISDGIFLYGMTSYGGANGFGNIFKIKPDGTGYVTLFESTIIDVREPRGSLISDGTFLYGMGITGGPSNLGTIFKIKPDGTMYSRLWDFDGVNGSSCWGSLISDGTFLYGMTVTGGVNDRGTIFRFSPAPPALPTITSFTPTSGPVGTTVVITGTNFSTIPADNAVRFNGTLATVTASSATSITTTVPVGATTGTITVTVGGNTATSASNFVVTTGAVINFTTQPTNNMVCEGSNTTFSVVAIGDTNLQYQWQIDNGGFVDLANGATYSGVNTATLMISNTSISFNGTIYRCNVIGDNSPNTSSGTATLTVKPLPTALISSNGSELIASAGDNYQWYQNDEVIAGATSSVFELMNFLEYAVYAVDVSVNGCTNTSNDFVYLITQNEIQERGWRIYPNPFTTTLSIELSSLEKMEIEIVDVLGRCVKRISQFNSGTIALDELEDGSYFLKIHSAKQSAHFRIIKAH